jgi:hypothetical protein
MIQDALAPLGLERPPTAGDVSDFGGYRDLRPRLPFLPRRRARETHRKEATACVDDAPLSPLPRDSNADVGQGDGEMALLSRTLEHQD